MEWMAVPGKAGETVKVLMATPEPEDWLIKCLKWFDNKIFRTGTRIRLLLLFWASRLLYCLLFLCIFRNQTPDKTPSLDTSNFPKIDFEKVLTFFSSNVHSLNMLVTNVKMTIRREFPFQSRRFLLEDTPCICGLGSPGRPLHWLEKQLLQFFSWGIPASCETS